MRQEPASALVWSVRGQTPYASFSRRTSPSTRRTVRRWWGASIRDGAPSVAGLSCRAADSSPTTLQIGNQLDPPVVVPVPREVTW